jgi:murein L,D-transpeptidase YcbB/YkuD
MLITKAITKLPKLTMDFDVLCRVFIIAFLIIAANSSSVFANNVSQPISKNESVNALNEGLTYALNNSSFKYIKEVANLYKSRELTPIWSNGYSYNNNAHALYNAISNARKLGLNPKDYDLEIIKYFLETTIDDPAILGKSDVTFTHAYVKLAKHINASSVSFDLVDEYALFEDDLFLSEYTKNTTVATAPQANNNRYQNQDPYTRLLNAIETYRELNDDFEPIILQKKSLSIGDISPEVIKAKNKLFQLGDYQNTDTLTPNYDEALALSVSKFQLRHGLDADGVLGKRTAREINKTLKSRRIQLEVNLHRAKQISELGESRYILVNVPEYKLYVIENGKTIYQTRVVVGKKKNKTPVLTSEITELVLNPYWNIPTSITKNEIIPKLQENPEYLSNNNMKIISKINNKNTFIDPSFVDWENIDPENAPIRIRQDPGKKNALGRVKFMFPNNYSVYLHDTPSRSLFSQNYRAFSHGCVRVEHPFEFAKVLLSASTDWTDEKFDYFANRDKTKVVKLENPIPIHITYMTAWADELGVINFRPDIYKRDSQIANNLYNTAQ